MAMQKHLIMIIFLYRFTFTSNAFASRTSPPLFSYNMPNAEKILQLLTSGPSASLTSPPLITMPTQTTWDQCDGLKYAINTNLYAHVLSTPTNWTNVDEDCEQAFKDYMTGDSYFGDSFFVWITALSFAQSVNVTDKDIWIFDVDDTLLSTISIFYTQDQGLRTSGKSGRFKIYSDYPSDLPPTVHGLSLYQQLQSLGFKIFLITGRNESLRDITEKNLQDAGYINWERLIMRQPSEEEKSALIYKSEKRAELENEGYTIQGNTGDQWSDLLGFPMAMYSFKFPNLMYYIP